MSFPFLRTEDYPLNTVVTLTATPTANNKFNGWTGAVTGAALSIQVTTDAPKTVTATFVPDVSLSGDFAGTLSKVQDFYTHDPAVFNAATGKSVTIRTLVSGTTITITPVSGFSPSALPTLTGTVPAAGGSFTATGTGTIAGQANATVTVTGTISNGALVITSMVVGGLPNGTITYSYNGTK